MEIWDRNGIIYCIDSTRLASWKVQTICHIFDQSLVKSSLLFVCLFLFCFFRTNTKIQTNFLNIFQYEIPKFQGLFYKLQVLSTFFGKMYYQFFFVFDKITEVNKK